MLEKAAVLGDKNLVEETNESVVFVVVEH